MENKTDSIKTLEQGRAKFAYDYVNSVANDNDELAKKFASYVKKFPMMVKTNGLGSYITNVYNGTTILGTSTDSSFYTGWFNNGTIIKLNVDSPITNSSERKVSGRRIISTFSGT